jgi:transposase InsO family protein
MDRGRVGEDWGSKEMDGCPLTEVWKHHETPRVVFSDRGPQFIAAFMRKLYKLLGIKLAISTAYHPQTNGQMEHINQVLEGYLRTFTS